MQSVVTALSQHQHHHATARRRGSVGVSAAAGPPLGGLGGTGGKDSPHPEGGEGSAVLGELQELAERMACTAVDAQKDHPIGFRR